MQIENITMPSIDPKHEKDVRGMYAMTNSVALKKCGIGELTEGRYEGNPDRPYALAQELQQKHLLNLGNLKLGDRMLDIGCGHGVLLREAQNQGIISTGITLSEDQIEAHHGLDTYLLNWRNILLEKQEWKGLFDGLLAIGSLEHFVSPHEAARAENKKVYMAFFKTCDWLLKPGGRLVVTAINYLPSLVPPPRMARNQFFEPWRWRTPMFHLGSLAWLGGCYYPTVGELPQIAKECNLNLLQEEDGTEDYYYTSEAWIKSLRASFLKLDTFKEVWQKFKKYPKQAVFGTICINLFESWNWQFRKQNGKAAPTKLLRYVWEKK